MIRACPTLPLALALLALLAGGAWLMGQDRQAAAQTLGDIASQARSGAVAAHGLFGSVELRSEVSSALPQWERIVRWLREEGPGFARCIDDQNSCRSAAHRDWGEMMAEARGLSRREQLGLVNRFFNQWPYRFDDEIYGVSDYWANPWEFLQNSGDCEDYAIAKYYSLRQLGFEDSELRIVTLLDAIRNIGHAVLSVEIDGQTLILDNLSNGLFEDSAYTHYVPYYSVNKTERWAHVAAGQRRR